MGNDESKQWVLENMLFLDPNAPPFISQEEYERRLAEEARRRNEGFNPYSEVDGKKHVKRTTPAETQLRTRSFRVLVDVNGRRSEFLLKCINDPLAFVLCDRSGRELRRLPAAYLRQIERKKDVVTCRFRTADQHATAAQKQPQVYNNQEQTLLITFTFFDSSDTQGFVDTVRLLYGISVAEYGVTKTRNKATDDSKSPLLKAKARPPCAIHGSVPCHCGSRTRNRQEDDVAAEVASAVLSKEFPITIVGKLETGSVLKWTDVSVLAKVHPPKAVEWRVSYVPGREPEFAVRDSGDDSEEWNVLYDDALLVTSDMTGKFIQVKVTRRVKDVSKRLPVVYSVAVKGPVTLNDVEARDVLHIITQPEYLVNVEVDADALLRFFPDAAHQIERLAQQQPFMGVSFGINRQGISISSPEIDERYLVTLAWDTFYATRLTPASSSLGNEEDLFLQLHVKKSSKRQLVFRFATPSERERNALYNAIYFLKLQKNFKNFDRWAVDLAQGNYAVFKQRYGKLWAAVNFYDDIVDTLQPVPLFMQNTTQTESKRRSAVNDDDNNEQHSAMFPDHEPYASGWNAKETESQFSHAHASSDVSQ